jgi:hypothetical protein
MSFLFFGKLLEGDSPKSMKETIIDLQQEVEKNTTIYSWLQTIKKWYPKSIYVIEAKRLSLSKRL